MAAYLGIDPATRTGLALIVDATTVRTRRVCIPADDHAAHVAALREIIGDATVARAGIETQYIGRHAGAGLSVVMHRAAWDAACVDLGIDVAHMAPDEWRRYTVPTVRGRDAAKQAQRAWALRKFGVDVTDDEADALGLAFAASVHDDRMTTADVASYLRARGYAFTDSQFRARVRAGTFPPPDTNAGPKARWWRRSTVAAWIAVLEE
jgi:Holliday junction resolvasome RuvABC endonuclease subunit